MPDTTTSPIWTPYDPDDAIGDFGWLWLDGPIGHEWVLVHTFGEEDGLFVDLIGRMEADGTRESRSGYHYAGTPYLPCIAPGAVPGECDAFEVAIRFAPGRSATHAFGHGYQLEAVKDATFAAMAACRITNAAFDVMAERRRQIEAEGWTAECDDQHTHGALAWAAACYLQEAASEAWTGTGDCPVPGSAPEQWPFAGHFWKPASQRRNLVKAGALILAEIERLDRMQSREGRGEDA